MSGAPLWGASRAAELRLPARSPIVSDRSIATNASRRPGISMHEVAVAAGALNQTPLDWSGNRDRILTAIDRARDASIAVLCLPELCVTGYGCEDAFHSPDVADRAMTMVAELAPATEEIAVSVGLPVRFRGALFNACALLADGRLEGFVAKRRLAGDGVHYEPRWFNPWVEGRRTGLATDTVGDRPFGDVVFDCRGLRIGFEICEDAWAGDRPGESMARQGVDLILNPSASHFAFGKQRTRKRFVLDASRAFGVGYVYANLLGNESGRLIYDGGTMIAAGGSMVANGPRFSYRDVVLTAASIDIDRVRMRRGQLERYRPRIDEDGGETVSVDFRPPETRLEATAGPDGPEWWGESDEKQEQFTRAASLALFDYLRKSGAEGFIVSLSGGADSSTTACLAALAVRMAVDDLGLEAVLEKLDHIEALSGAESPREMIGRLLTTAYQATRHSSETTRRAADTVASAVGAEHLELDVDPLVEGYVDRIEEAVGRELTWESDDITLQNIQARARAPSIWMLANLRDALLLATSNRSEGSVGYTTMDGDTCGGLSPIAGIDKAFIREWLVWMRDAGPRGLDPLPELEVITDQSPTPELRPSAADQTDEGDLMPYQVLDAIERAAIRDKYAPAEVYQRLASRLDRYTARQLAEWIEMFFRRWARHQWKRERYAPSFHLDDENIDPKTWCRFPILSGGYDDEIAAMWRRCDGTE